MWLVEDNPAQTIDQIKEQEQLYAEMREKLVGKYGALADLHTAAYYGVAVDSTLWKPLMDFATGRIQTVPVQFTQWLNDARLLAKEPRHRFFHWELEFPEIFFDKYGQAKGEQAGFDAVIGNPPWIHQEAFSQDKPILKLHYATYNGQADLSTYFVELGNTYLKENGRFGFIIPNKFVRARYGKVLRHFLAEQVTLERIVNFGDLPVFTDTVTYPMIVLTSNKLIPKTEAQVACTHLKQLRPKHLAEDILAGETHKPARLFSGEHWPLTEDDIQLILDKMKTDTISLGAYVENKIFYGIKTGDNEAFVIDRRMRDQLIAYDPTNKEIIKPFLMGSKDVKRYHMDFKERYVLFVAHGTDINKYKAIEDYLSQFKNRLEPRPVEWNEQRQGKWRGRKPGPYQWYEIQDNVAYHKYFEQPKIVWPIIASGNQFTLVEPGYYSNDKTFFMPTDDLYLLAILNSSLMFLYLRNRLTEKRGDFWEYQKDKLVQAPIRRILFTTDQRERNLLVTDGISLYNSGKYKEFLVFGQNCLHHVPQQCDVLHDILIFLAKEMLSMNKQRQIAQEDLLLALESVLSSSDMKKLDRLWTPLSNSYENDSTISREAQEILGDFINQQIDLHEDIGMLNEDQWKWLLKRRLVKPDLVDLVKIYRKYQPPVAQLDQRIATIDNLINQIVYRLYGLTAEEIEIVEEHLRN